MSDSSVSVIPDDIREQLNPSEREKARKGWRIFLGILIGVQIAFSDMAIFCLGFGWWHIDGTLLVAFFAKIVAEVIGLTYIAVRYDFPDEAQKN